MTVVAIHQPHYLPWQPYLAKALACDVFIYLDNVQYQKNGVQNRNQVKTSHGPKWLTVPVHRTSDHALNQTLVATGNWPRKHIETVLQSYRGAPGLNWFCDALAPVISREHLTLADLAIATTEAFLERLGARCRRIRSSELRGEGTKGGLVIDLARKAGATQYLSGEGARAYQSSHAFDDAGIGLHYARFKQRDYPQRHDSLGFLPGLSTLDLLLNVPEDASRYLSENLTIETASCGLGAP